ncbi:hypothetical protein L202_06388 [Cryptococcus amylolentus CBS 6039]|uniref:Transcription factor spt8 beta-propeller domain-containing protein n=1 Tax=Cryptococcus amylolentus CBS 6039 TaxID=1295533 RepID=A0A1E3HFS3_9TREE|nr:hypothetical protein L202_06388 [Cryptococcus amylolentus CBS 6039]ODN75190.1 hypothetical protein L202_06388 [Cryptococcus amylolentus CBS 6039]
MRSDEEDDEEEFYDENEEDEVNADGEEEGEEEGSDDDGSEEDNAEDEDEDEDEEDEDGEDEEEEEGGDDDDDGSEDEGQPMDVDAPARNGERPVSQPPQPARSATPPHLVRRSFLKPAFNLQYPPRSLSVEVVAGIPLPTPIHSLGSSNCMSYLLAGGQDGFIRAYDFWGTVNGTQTMTAQQRSVVGLGETVNKAGVARGWWTNEVEGIVGGTLAKRPEAVYSMACDGDALWTLAGTQSGPINLYTLRHSPGHLVHTLKGHTNVVSCMTLLPEEKSFISGSWDGTVKEWDLNTGQATRSYPSHKAQISSIALRPTGISSSPPSSPAHQKDEDGEETGNGLAANLNVSVGPDFFQKRDGPSENENGLDKASEGKKLSGESGDVDMASATTPNSGAVDSLFGDEASESEQPLASILPTNEPPPSLPSPDKPKTLGLALPGQRPTITIPPQQPQAQSRGQNQVLPQIPPGPPSAPLFKPLLPTSAKQAAADHIPVLSPAGYKNYSDDVLLTSSMDGQLVLIDRRVPSYEGAGAGVGRLVAGEKTPPWCMSATWLSNGNQVLAGRRNGTVEVWDVRKGSNAANTNILRTLRTPAGSGPISSVVAFPDGQHIATASTDNLRLWNAAELFQPEDSIKRSKGKTPFRIIAGHHGGTISSMIVDSTCRFLVTAGGDRGWGGESTKAVLIHEIKW